MMDVKQTVLTERDVDLSLCVCVREWLYKQTNKIHFLYVFILQFLYSSTCFERPFLSSSGVHDLLYQQLCTKHAKARFVQSCWYSKSWTSDDERNGRSKYVEVYKNCRINTNRKCILLVCKYNWLRCTVHTMSNVCVNWDQLFR